MRLALALAFTLMAAPLIGQVPQSPVTLDQLHDRFRPLLLFAASPDDPALQAQLTRLKSSAAGLSERDVLLIALPYRSPSPTETSLSDADAATTRRRFHVASEDFTIILLGKDGGEKLRSKKPVSFERLRDLIDSMPMRQQEAKDRARR